MTRKPEHVVSFDKATLAPAEILTADPAVVDKPFRAKSWRFFEKKSTGSLAGIWEAEPHLERVACDYDELCHILEGTVRLTDHEGHAATFTAGDSFVVKAGFRGTWENLTHVRKVYFIQA